MARKASAEASSAHNISDIVGVVLLAVALLLLVAQFSFDRNDLPDLRNPPNHPTHNWIGPLGARLAYVSFLACGFSAYMLPLLLGAFALGCWFDVLAYLKRRWPWAVVLLVSCMGWLHLLDLPHAAARTSLITNASHGIGTPCVGGVIGMQLYEDFFWMVGPIGAGIVYGALDVISLLFLCNFQLGPWLRAIWTRGKTPATVPAAAVEEQILERRARELKKQARQLQDEVERSGLGADGKPVPEPTVRDLSVPQAKASKGKRATPTEPPPEPAPADLGEVIPAREVAAATSADILGKKPPAGPDPSETQPGEPEPGTPASGKDAEEKKPDTKPEPEITINGLPKPRPAPRRPKPITVASTPIIGNYRLPSLDFLQTPDLTVKPTESKEELMANARLMQQTLAQFDIEVALGDITKGPTITRYELHPAPG